MEVLYVILVAILFVIVSFLAGVLVGTSQMRKAVEEGSIGNLRIDRSEPDEPPRPFLEVTSGNIETISKMGFVILKVVNENYISCK